MEMQFICLALLLFVAGTAARPQVSTRATHAHRHTQHTHAQLPHSMHTPATRMHSPCHTQLPAASHLAYPPPAAVLSFLPNANQCCLPRQDLGTGMMLAAAQVKDLIESGAAARNDQSVEVLGQKMRSQMELGFGDAMRPPGIGRRRRDLRLFFDIINA